MAFYNPDQMPNFTLHNQYTRKGPKFWIFGLFSQMFVDYCVIADKKTVKKVQTCNDFLSCVLFQLLCLQYTLQMEFLASADSRSILNLNFLQELVASKSISITSFSDQLMVRNTDKRLSINDVHTFPDFLPPPRCPSRSVTYLTTPLCEDVPFHYPPPSYFFEIIISLSYQTKKTKKNYLKKIKIACTCERPTGLHTPSTYCHILSYIPLPPPPITGTSFMDAPPPTYFRFKNYLATKVWLFCNSYLI